MVEYAQTTYGTVDPVRFDARGHVAAPLARMLLANNSGPTRGGVSSTCRETDRRFLSHFFPITSPCCRSVCGQPSRVLRPYTDGACSSTPLVVNASRSTRGDWKQLNPPSTPYFPGSDNTWAIGRFDSRFDGGLDGLQPVVSRALKEPRIFGSAPAP